MSRVREAFFAIIPFQELCWEHFELSFARAIEAQFLAHHGVYVKLGRNLCCVCMRGHLNHLYEALQATFYEPVSECRGDDGRNLGMIVFG